MASARTGLLKNAARCADGRGVRSAPATLLGLAALAVLGLMAFSLGRARQAATTAPAVSAATTHGGGGATPEVPATRMLDDPRFDITFRYPSELRLQRLHPIVDRGKRQAARIALYAPRLGWIEVGRTDDDASEPMVDRDAASATRFLRGLVRRDFPGAGFHIAPHRIHGLPVTELQFTRPARLRNAYNIFTWVGTTAYRIECHHRAEPAAAMELQRACHDALLSLALRPALAAAPGRTRAG